MDDLSSKGARVEMDFYHLSISEKIAVLEKEIFKKSLVTLVAVVVVSLAVFVKTSPTSAALHPLLAHETLVETFLVVGLITLFVTQLSCFRLTRHKNELQSKLI